MSEERNRPISGGKAVVECLKAYNIKYVFGLIGSATMELFDALYDEKNINFVDVRENAAEKFDELKADYTENLDKLKNLKKEDFGIHLNVCFNKIEKDPNNEIAKKLFNNIWDEKFYFLHRYYMNSEDDDSQVLYSIKNKKKIPSVLIKNNIVGIQFHPELSFEAGVKFFKNFYSL